MSEQEAFSSIPDLAELVEVQTESTVSRTVFRSPRARVVLFAFDTGQELTEHTAAMPVLLQVPEGRLAITADGRTEDLGPGGLMFLDTRVPHAVYAHEPSKLVLIMLDDR